MVMRMKSEEHMRIQLIREANEEVLGIIARHKTIDSSEVLLLLKIALVIMVRLRRFLRVFANEKEMKKFIRDEIFALRKLKSELRNKIIDMIIDVMFIH